VKKGKEGKRGGHIVNYSLLIGESRSREKETEEKGGGRAEDGFLPPIHEDGKRKKDGERGIVLFGWDAEVGGKGKRGKRKKGEDMASLFPHLGVKHAERTRKTSERESPLTQGKRGIEKGLTREEPPKTKQAP